MSTQKTVRKQAGSVGDNPVRLDREKAEQIIDALEGELVKNAINVPSVEATAYPRIRNYVEVAETASTVAMRLFEGRVEEIEITYAGAIADEDLDLVTAAVFKPYGWQDQVVNAPARIAERRGIDVTESRRRETKDYRSLVSITVGDGTDSLVPTRGQPALLRLSDQPDGYHVTYEPVSAKTTGRRYECPFDGDARLYGRTVETTVQADELASILDGTSLPVVYDGAFHWSNDLANRV